MPNYNNYYPYTPAYQLPAAVPAAPQPGINWVQGETGAKSYLVAAGQSVLLMDSESSTFYIKSTDQSGMPMPLRTFDYKEREKTREAASFDPEKYVTHDELQKLSAELIGMIKGGKNGE